MNDVLQKSAASSEPRGRLNPESFRQNITFQTYAPPSDLALFIEHFWIIRWDKVGAQPYISEQVMHRPYVDVYLSGQLSGVQGTFRFTRMYEATGSGRIIGIRFRPGAFHAFWPGQLIDTIDKTLDLQLVFPKASRQYIADLLSLDDEAALARLAELVRTKHAEADPNIDIINKIIAIIEVDTNLQTVKTVARYFNKSERWLQQLFRDYTGIGLKWLLQRKKLLIAAQHIRVSDNPDWAAIAYDCGYSSQQHFITDFKQALGKTPRQYKHSLQK